jgi:hypothetical protein
MDAVEQAKANPIEEAIMKHRNLSLTSAGVFLGAIHAFSVSAQTWSPTTAPAHSWSSVAMSADGTRIVAVANVGPIYTSANYGSTWVSNSAPSTAWSGAAASADGTRLVAVAGGIYTNSGTTWALAFNPPRNHLIGSVAASADGAKLVAADYLLFSQLGIYTSANSGATWQSVTTSPSVAWRAVASSMDGSRLAAARGNNIGGSIYTSANGGALWVSNNAPNLFWTSLVSSANGSNLLAIGASLLYRSDDAGATWAAVPDAPEPINGIACSTNGNIWFAVSSANGEIYSSFNAGASWTTNLADRLDWSAIAVSADGSQGVAASGSGEIYILGSLAPPPLTVIAVTTNKVSLLWSTNYQQLGASLQQNTDLMTTNWVSVSGTPTVTNTFFQLTLPATNRQLFFRLK